MHNPALDSALVYQIMASDRIEPMIQHTRGHLGKWVKLPVVEKNQRAVHSFVNDGIPLRFDFTQMSYERFEMTRERTIFFWEDEFKIFAEKSNNWTEWLDGEMWPDVRPQDLRFGIFTWKKAVQENIGIVGHTKTAAHFQPVGWDDLESNRLQSGFIEIEEIFAAIGASYTVHWYDGNAYTFEGNCNNLRQELTDLGFTYDQKLSKPPKTKVTAYD